LLRIYQDKPLCDTAVSEARLNLWCDIDQPTPGGYLEPEFFAI